MKVLTEKQLRQRQWLTERISLGAIGVKKIKKYVFKLHNIKIGFCDDCKVPYIECDICGNSSCTGTSGIWNKDGTHEECQDKCELMYAISDAFKIYHYPLKYQFLYFFKNYLPQKSMEIKSIFKGR